MQLTLPLLALLPLAAGHFIVTSGPINPAAGGDEPPHVPALAHLLVAPQPPSVPRGPPVKRAALTCAAAGYDKQKPGASEYYTNSRTLVNCYNRCLRQTNCKSFAFGNPGCLLYTKQVAGNFDAARNSKWKFYDVGCVVEGVRLPVTTTTSSSTTSSSTSTTRSSTTSSSTTRATTTSSSTTTSRTTTPATTSSSSSSTTRSATSASSTTAATTSTTSSTTSPTTSTTSSSTAAVTTSSTSSSTTRSSTSSTSASTTSSSTTAVTTSSSTSASSTAAPTTTSTSSSSSSSTPAITTSSSTSSSSSGTTSSTTTTSAAAVAPCSQGRRTVDNAVFDVTCSTQFGTGTTIQAPFAASWDRCLSFCVAAPTCIGVQWGRTSSFCSLYKSVVESDPNSNTDIALLRSRPGLTTSSSSTAAATTTSSSSTIAATTSSSSSSSSTTAAVTTTSSSSSTSTTAAATTTSSSSSTSTTAAATTTSSSSSSSSTAAVPTTSSSSSSSSSTTAAPTTTSSTTTTSSSTTSTPTTLFTTTSSSSTSSSASATTTTSTSSSSSSTSSASTTTSSSTTPVVVGTPSTFAIAPYPSNLSPTTYNFRGTSQASSDHFLVWNSTAADAAVELNALEAAYDCFVVKGGWRNPGVSWRNDPNVGPFYKVNYFTTPNMPVPYASGVTTGDDATGLAYVWMLPESTMQNGISVHEFGHVLNIYQQQWWTSPRAQAWAETIAQYVNEAFNHGPECAASRAAFNVPDSWSLFQPAATISQSYLTLVDSASFGGYGNQYQAWPFLSYLSYNPDKYAALGKDTLLRMLQQYSAGSNETPLHTLARVAAPQTPQQLVGRYWARMAWVDFGDKAMQQTWNYSRPNLDYDNTDAVDATTWRVKAAKKPLYMGANIIPLRTTTGSVTVTVNAPTAFTATIAIRSLGYVIKYIELTPISGSTPTKQATFVLEAKQSAMLVVANTPDTLLYYLPYQLTGDVAVGLDWTVSMTGASPLATLQKVPDCIYYYPPYNCDGADL